VDEVASMRRTEAAGPRIGMTTQPAEAGPSGSMLTYSEAMDERGK
jgi:hypothetical protein